jgi:hypothetical protein
MVMKPKEEPLIPARVIIAHVILGILLIAPMFMAIFIAWQWAYVYAGYVVIFMFLHYYWSGKLKRFLKKLAEILGG